MKKIPNKQTKRHNCCNFCNELTNSKSIMSENILSLEDLKFLEDLYFKNGIESLRFDDKGLKLNNENSFPTKEGSSFDECYLCELAKKNEIPPEF